MLRTIGAQLSKLAGTRSSAVDERLRVASCHWIFR